MRSLMACGKFGSVEIVMLFADALQAAAQEVVAREMSAHERCTENGNRHRWRVDHYAKGWLFVRSTRRGHAWM
jgi:hypothetical protein